MQFSVVSPVSAAAAPFCIGFAFRRGDIPAGQGVVGSIATLQVVPKNVWPDGSLKFGVVSGQTALVANQPMTISLAKGTPAPATGLGLANLRATGITASVGCGAYGTASWTGADWEAPFQVWVVGPEMSSWIYRKPVGSDAHLVAWLEVRVFASGAVEVLPWVENGYLRVAGPTSKSATYTFTLGGTQRFSAAVNLPHHCRTPLVSGAALSYWLGADPAVTPRHDVVYMQATELVPSYYAAVSPSAAVVTALPATFTPLQKGSFNYQGDSMPGAGYQEPIGLLPQHDVLYLTANVMSVYGTVVRNGFSAGRYPVHYRDETTNRPLRFSAYPTLNINDGSFKDTGGSSTGSYTPVPSGTAPPLWDVSHSPSLGYMAYLITGRWYFMEEVQFATTCNYLGNGDNANLRTGSQGLVQTAVQAWQTRSCAWDWRTRVQALCVTPDSDTALRNEFINSVKSNIDHFYNRYVAQPNNPFGWILPGETYNDKTSEGATWQQDFVTAAFGYSVSLGLPLPAAYQAKLLDFFKWKAKSAVGRLGTSSQFWYVNGAPYTARISAAAVPNFVAGTGPWYPDEAAMYAATYATAPSWMGSTEGTLAGEIMPGDRAMWGNLQPAIAYAVRHGVTGAQAAYDRMISATNWPALRSAFNAAPVWSVKPAGFQVAAPAPAPQVQAPAVAGAAAWMAGKPLNQWFEIPGTAGAGGAAINAFSGFAFDERTSSIVIAAAGGHMDSADNRVVSLMLSSNAPGWVVRRASSASAAANVAYYADGTPSSRHLYHSSHVVESLDRVFLFGARAVYGSAWDFATVDAFNLSTNQWDPAGTWAPVPSGGGYGAVKVRATGDVYTTSFYKWGAATRSWSQPITARTSEPVRWPIAHDALRNQLFSLQWGDGQGYGQPGIFATRVPLGGSAQVRVTFNASAALNQFQADAPTYAGMDYDADNDRFLFYCGQGAGAGRIYVIKPNNTNVWDMSVLGLVGGSALPPSTSGSGVYSRFCYVPKLKGFVLLATAQSNLYFIRTA